MRRSIMSADIAKFFVNDIVFHAVDEDPGIVTGIIFRENGTFYEVKWRGRCRDEHAAGELSRERCYFPSGNSGDDDRESTPA